MKTFWIAVIAATVAAIVSFTITVLLALAAAVVYLSVRIGGTVWQKTGPWRTVQMQKLSQTIAQRRADVAGQIQPQRSDTPDSYLVEHEQQNQSIP